jgi:phosphatidylglycerophosphate synthase
MTFENQVFVVIPAICIVRDIIVDGYRIQASSKGIIVPANQ